MPSHEAPKVALVVAAPPLEDAQRMLSAWAWLLPSQIQPLSVNRFGDWYFATSDGAVHMLSIWEGTIVSVAPSRTEWEAWLSTADGMEANWVELVLLLYDRGHRLGGDECFAFVPPPSITGEIDIDNIIVSNLGAMTAAMGETFRQTVGR